jgi:hypothetical protein
MTRSRWSLSACSPEGRDRRQRGRCRVWASRAHAGHQGAALVPDLVVQHADPGADARALDRLAVWLLRCSPVVATNPPDWIVLDIRR